MKPHFPSDQNQCSVSSQTRLLRLETWPPVDHATSVRKKGWEGNALIAFFDASSSLSVPAAIKDIQKITVARIAGPRLYFL